VAFWSARAARRARVPAFVVTQHETRLNTLPPGLKRTVWVGLEEWALARADAILPVSEATARDLAQRRPDLAGRIHVVHGSAPMLLEADALPRAQPARRAGESLRLVTVGRFSFEKGYDRLLESLALLAGRGLDFGLDVVGHGDLESEMRARVGRLGLEPRVRWHTGGLGLPALLARAHLYVTASRNEGLSVAALEAMAIGLPIVATDVGGMPELVVDGVTGILVSGHPEASLPERFAEAVARAAADPEGARRMGEAAARRARGTFGPARMAETITACYRALLARREPATDETRIEGRTS
jgi:glycosyltransferase involved in cell wall biosynthesis